MKEWFKDLWWEIQIYVLGFFMIFLLAWEASDKVERFMMIVALICGVAVAVELFALI